MRHNAKRVLVLFLVLLMTLAAFPQTASAASPKTVRVTVPDFPVRIGGQLIDPANEEYPFLVYNEITYLPLTYYGCQLLGLYAEWKSPETGLIISDTGTKGTYVSSPRVSSNAGILTAEVATGKIAIKGVPIDNTKEEWPFLLFREITYIPMTWANMHDTLGCDYRWDETTGLSIDRTADEAANVLHLSLSNDNSDVEAYDGYFWYCDENGDISRISMTGGAPELVMELPVNYVRMDGGKVIPEFWIANGKLYMQYHIGGGIMGSFRLFRLNADGTATSLASNANVLETPEYLVRTDTHMVLGRNIWISRDQGTTWDPLGNPAFLYGGNTAQDEPRGSFTFSTKSHGYLCEANGLIYTTVHNTAAGDETSEYYEPDAVFPSASRVSSVDPVTGETTFLTEYASAFCIENDSIYYLSVPDHILKVCDLDGGNVRALTSDDVFVSDFKVVNGTVYYTADLTKTTEGNYHEWIWATESCPLFVLTPDGPKQIGTTPLRKMEASEGYLIALLQEDGENPASDPVRLAVYDGETEIYTIRGADVIGAGIADGNLYYVLR